MNRPTVSAEEFIREGFNNNKEHASCLFCELSDNESIEAVARVWYGHEAVNAVLTKLVNEHSSEVEKRSISS